MKNATMKTMMAAAVMTFSLAVMTAGDFTKKFTAEVPHSFSISGKALPPGHYDILQNGPRLFQFRNKETRESAILMTTIPLGVNKSTPRLVLRSYGDTWKVAEFWTDTDGAARVPSAEDRSYEREGAGRVALVTLRSIQ